MGTPWWDPLLDYLVIFLWYAFWSLYYAFVSWALIIYHIGMYLESTLDQHFCPPMASASRPALALLGAPY